MWILIIEDDPFTLELLTNGLEENGYTIETCMDGLEGEVMAESGKALAGTDLRVEPLYEALVELREQNAQHPDFKPRLVVQGDRSIEFRLLQRVMYTGQIAGFTDVSLAVIQDEATPEVALGGETDS